jgi:PAS domain S-box-containing protein
MREVHAIEAEARTAADTVRLVHELEVHQIELEMQNEELRESRDAMEAALEKYSDLYDFAPVGYLTIDREGAIREANLAAASLFGIERSRLLGQRLIHYFAPADGATITAFFLKAGETKARESCELTLIRNDERAIPLRIETTLAGSGEEFRIVVRDITERQRAEMDRLILSKLESTGILAGGIAHDFNNLLMVVLLNLEQAQLLEHSSADFSAPWQRTSG